MATRAEYKLIAANNENQINSQLVGGETHWTPILMSAAVTTGGQPLIYVMLEHVIGK